MAVTGHFSYRSYKVSYLIRCETSLPTMTKAFDAFERAIRDAEQLLARYDAEKSASNGHNGEVLKRAGLVMALAAWETYVKDRIHSEIDTWLQAVDGSPIGKFVRRRLEEDLKRFFNPNSERTRRIFIEYFDTDITKDWVWDNYDSSTSKKALDALIAKRGDAAHKANTAAHSSAEPHKVKREELEKGIRFLKGLVAATEKAKITK
ncbi:HEPN domain-containing protein [Methylomonas methanica]|nr:HEPN domain-containing protein [Methylomonas methanica]